MLSKEQICQYLQKGFIWGGIYSHPLPIQSDISFADAKIKFWYQLEDIVKLYAQREGVLWTMSSGLDTSSILSHVRTYNNNPETICLDNGRGDAEFSRQLSGDWGFDNHVIATIGAETIEEYLLEINDILSYPVAHSYIFMSYWLFKYTEENGFNTLIMGDGPDVSMLGTHVLHRDIIETAIKLEQYDLKKADDVIKESKYFEPSMVEHSRLLWNVMKRFDYLDELPEYNTTYFYNTWSRDDIIETQDCYPTSWNLRKNTLHHRVWAEWDQFLVRTRKPTDELLTKFNFNQVSPYIQMSDFCMTLPFEYRYCLHSTKHLMLDTYGIHLPLYITYKERTGFNPSDPWANRYSKKLEYLMDKYVFDKNKKIHDHVNVGKLYHMGNKFFTFNQKWSLINLSMWLDAQKT